MFQPDDVVAHITEDNINLLDRRVDFLFTTNGFDPNGTKVDFGDGIHTWEDVNWNETMSITYPDLATREIRFFKPNIKGNQPIGTFTISFATAGLGTAYEFRLPDATWFVEAESAYSPPGCTMPSPFYFPECESEQGQKTFYWQGGTGSGNAYIRYGQGNDGVLRKPVIFVEGIDFSFGGSINPDQDPANAAYRTQYGAFGWDVFTTGHGRSKGSDYSEFALYPLFFQQLHDEGYDLILLDFADGATYIQKNAEVLKALLRQVNNHKEAHGITASNIVIGASMGGLVARYALASMEQEGENHCAGTFVSFDSPHKGAHLPLGVQAAGKDKKYGGCPLFESLWVSLNRPASHQMIIDHFGDAMVQGRLIENRWTNNGEEGPQLPHPEGDFNCLRTHFKNELDVLGFPKYSRNIAIACGSATGTFQNELSTGSGIIDAELDFSDFGKVMVFDINSAYGSPGPDNKLIRRTLGDCDFVNRLSGEEDNILFTAAIPNQQQFCDYYVLGYGYPPREFASSFVRRTGEIMTIDHVPGAYRNDLQALQGLMGNVLECRGITEAIQYNHPTRDELCFIPTLSALDLDLPLNTQQAESSWSEEQLVSLSPFDKVWASQGENLKHVQLTQGIGDWLLNELQSFDQAGLTLPHAAGPEYNFGNKLRTIPRTLVQNGGTLYINDAGILQFRNVPESTTKETHEAWTKSCNADITVEDGGAMILGEDKTDAVTRRAIVHITSGTRVHIKAGGTLRLAQGSTLIVEEGAALTLDYDAIVDLRTSADRISVRGELELGGEIDFSGLGYFEFFNSHTLTLSGGLMSLAGAAKEHRFIRLDGDTELQIGNALLELKEGAVDYGPEARISLTSSGRVRLQSVTLRPDAGASLAPQVTGIHADNPRGIWLKDCDVLGLGVGVHGFVPASASPSNPFLYNAIFYSFDQVLFRGCSTGIQMQGIRQMQVSRSTFDALAPGAEPGGLVSGRFGLHATDMDLVWSYQSNFIHYEDASRSDMPGGDIAAIRLYDIQAFRSHANTIDQNDIGIFSPGQSRSNVFMYSGTTVSNNVIGVWMRQGGVDPQGHDYGIVLMDCSNLINNNYGIKGLDILLQIDAPIAGGSFPGKVSPNTFIAGDDGNRLFDICYLQRYDIQTVFARGNYWEPVPQIQHWRLFNMGGMGQPCGNQPSNVGLNYQPLLAEQDLLARYCPADPVFDTDPDNGPGDPTGGGLAPGPEDYSCIMMYGATNIQAHETFALSLQEWYYVDTLAGLEGFTQLASTPDAMRDTMDPICRHYIDMARIFVSRDDIDMPPVVPFQGIPPGQGFLSSGFSQAAGAMRILPNPAGSEVKILWPGKSDYIHVRIFDMYGRLVRQHDLVSGQSLNIGDIPVGIWMVEIQDVAEGKRYMDRLTIVR